MEQLIVYMVKASGLIGLFFIAYHLFLRKETFFNTNRWFLLAGLITSVLLPAIVYTEVVWINPLPQQPYRELSMEQLMAMHNQATAVKVMPEPGVTINWYDVAAGIYIAGAIFFFIRFTIEIWSLRRQLSALPIVKEGQFLLVDSPKVKSPFSFFNYIVYNSAVLHEHELESIISHEKVHSAQKHSLDMVISQLFCIAFWFNPFSWIYRKSISQNLEFIADAEATKLIADKEAYQKTLLKITVQPECIAITNHFYQSLIKKRIVMLNKQQSKKRNSWKYAAVLPALVAFMLLFQVKVVAQVKKAPETKISKVSAENVSWSVEIHKDMTDEQLKKETEIFKEEFDTDVNVQNVKRNQKEEITGIKITAKDKTQSRVYEVAGTEPIAPFTIEIGKSGNGSRNIISFGSSAGTRLGSTAMTYIDIDTLTNNQIFRGKITIPEPPAAPGEPRAYRIPTPPTPPSGDWSVNSFKIGGDEMLIVINGVKQEKGESIKLPLNEDIDQINILKEKDGKKKYGKDGKKGVVEITTKKSNSWVGLRNPESYLRMFPGGDGQEFSFNFNFDDEAMARMREGLENMRSFQLDMEGLSPEELAKIQDELSSAQEEIQKSLDGLQFSFDDNMTTEEINSLREELKEARKEMMEAKKEMMEARKEALKQRKTEGAKSKKTVYRKV